MATKAPSRVRGTADLDDNHKARSLGISKDGSEICVGFKDGFIRVFIILSHFI